MSTYQLDKTFALDSDQNKKQESFRKHVRLIKGPNETYSIDLSYYRTAGNPRLEGQFVGKGSNIQGAHTVSYALLLAAVERRLSGKTLPDMLRQIEDRVNPLPTLNGDLYTFFYIYSKIDGKASNYYLMEKLKNVYLATIKLISDIYLLEQNQLDKFEISFMNYLYAYLTCLLSIPFSAAAEKSIGRGERVKILDQLNDERSYIGFLSKLFDENAIEQLMKYHVSGKDGVYSDDIESNIVAFQLLGFLFMLEGYPNAKRYFFQSNGIRGGANLQNIATVVFCHWKKGKSRVFTNALNENARHHELINNGLSIISGLRFRQYQYLFLSGFN